MCHGYLAWPPFGVVGCQLDQPLHRFAPRAHPLQGLDAAVFQVKDRLDVEQVAEKRLRAADAPASLQVFKRVYQHE